MITLVLPGESLSVESLPFASTPSNPIRLGPGLRHVPPSTVTACLAGSIHIDHKKNAIWVEHSSGGVLVTRNT